MKLGRVKLGLKLAERRQALLKEQIYKQEVLLKINQHKLSEAQYLIQEYNKLLKKEGNSNE